VGEQGFWDGYRRDLYRYSGDVSGRAFLRHWFLTPGVKYTFYLRLCQWLRTQPFHGFGTFPVVKFVLIRAGVKLGMEIPSSTSVGEGLFIGHFGTIIVNGEATIGANCNLSHGVTIGQLNRGERAGCPTIGDNVFIGPGARILGRIVVGDDVAIGANSVVVDDVPDGAVVAGIPAKVVSMAGSHGYINNRAEDTPPRRSRHRHRAGHPPQRRGGPARRQASR
jgi:serine O-acetyltransferase